MNLEKPITTQEELDAIVSGRVDRERKKYADYEDLKKANDSYKTQISELNAAAEKEKKTKADADKQIADLTKKVSGYETAALRTKVALAAGIPYAMADRLHGTTEEEMTNDAENLKRYFQSQPHVETQPLADAETGTGKDAALKNMLKQLREH